ncbi:hypothetical protein [Faecalibacter bovis]|uniref:Lipopolysaccharide biosynthesis protein n=1 Tax=Faecalibacter bovis TaxID=2898187 RepID=A0ABX7X9L0_9FLAO|nr:hypothetical protein [Faecalibacter bovis]QTV04560.1 hypothetical protein J9309_06955 [Faecalibacter bovis]
MPSILFIYKNKNLADQFVKHFKLNGYSIHQFYDEELPYYKFSKLQQLENIFYRIFKRDTQHIHKIEQRNFISVTNKKLKKLEQKNLKFDFCFVIRGDLIPENVIRYARSISDKMVDYQLDGLSVSKKILDYDYLFDQIYVFDDKDVLDYPGYNLKSITNCFFEENTNVNKSIDFSYIGVNTENRFNILNNLYDILKDLDKNYVINFYLKQDEFHSKFSEKLIMINDSLNYKNCLEISNRTKVLIDLKRQEHNGLSLRFFEALNYKNKIITNNNSVLNYDFYHPDNIYITDYKNYEGLEEFLSKPYFMIDENIIIKYRFDNWIKNILYT